MWCFVPRIVDDQEEQRAQREAGVASLVQSSIVVS